MTEPATDRQMAYLRKLVAAAGEDLSEYLVSHGCTKLIGFPTATVVADVPSKAQASRLIDSLAPARSGRYGRRRPAARTYYRCTHEDFPSCGCER